MKIDQLPVEMLMKIIGYVPAYWEISLVNKLFYFIACQVNDPNIFLRIDQRFLQRFLCDNERTCQLMQSIKTTNRLISKVEVRISFSTIDEEMSMDSMESMESDNATSPSTIEHEQLIVSVFQKFSATIKILIIEYNPISELTFMEILSLIPNLEYLYITEMYFSDHNDDLSRNRLHCNDDLNLKKLKSLNISCASDELFTIFHRLPVGVLTGLHICCEWKFLPTLLNRQFNIKKLRLEPHVQDMDDIELSTDMFDEHVELPTEMFDNLELEELTFNFHRIPTTTIANVIAKQTKLKILIVDGVVDEQVMNAVANLSELEELGLSVAEITASSFVKIRRLKKLQELMLRFGDDEGTAEILKALSESDNTCIKKFTWLTENINSGLPVQLVGALAKSTPNLTDFKVICATGDGKEGGTILRHFNFIEVANIENFSQFSSEPVDYFNPKLRELSITIDDTCWFYETLLTQLIATYPNLKKLKVTKSSFHKSPFLIRPILDGFNKLESLTLRSDIWDCVVDDLDCLHNYKDTLKFVSFGQLHSTILTDDFVKSMRAIFGIVHIDDMEGYILNVAVDRYTMNCERETIRIFDYSLQTL